MNVLDPATSSETTMGWWTSPATGITYGSGSRLIIDALPLIVTPAWFIRELSLAHQGRRLLRARYRRGRRH
jgi:hypothetical protein